MRAYTHFSTRKTAQSQPIPGTNQQANNAGGYAWVVDDWTQLERFLVLGSEGGTYYVTEQKLTVDNAEAVMRCIKEDGPRVVKAIVTVSQVGRAPKNDPALFALAMCAGSRDKATRNIALAALPVVARIGTHLFHFLTYVQQFRGWGRGLREAVANWYSRKDADKLAYQLIKYRQRDGWTHRDVLRKCHICSKTDADRDCLYHWVTQGEGKGTGLLPPMVNAYIGVQACTKAETVAKYISQYNLPREAIPTEWLNDIDVWQALLQKMPLTALIRNLGKMTSIDLLKPMGENTLTITQMLSNHGYIKKSRVHPLAILVALKTYEQGHGVKGSLTWGPLREIIDALDNAFYLAFDNIEPIGNRVMLALDVSSSMAYNDIANMPGITPRVGAAAMAMVTARVEPAYMTMSFQDNFVPLPISPRQRLDDIIRKTDNLPFGGTDCSQPMLYALQKRIPIDTFVIYTDSETWCGCIHAAQALQQYRREMNIPAKLVVVGMVSNGFSIADPNDGGMLDVVGFDTATPNVISDFAKR